MKKRTVCAPPVFRAWQNAVIESPCGPANHRLENRPSRLLLELATKTAIKLVPRSAMSRGPKNGPKDEKISRGLSWDSRAPARCFGRDPR